jgi:2'-hydroxyisoflavone reductase
MNVLILGGTRFVGWHIATRLLAAGVSVTLCHRGATHPKGLSRAERLLIDRDAGDAGPRLSEYATQRRWDAVVDCSARTPKHVTDAASCLVSHVGRYILLSTASVYARRADTLLTEDSPLKIPAQSDHAQRDSSAQLKRACESALCEILRPSALPLVILRLAVVTGRGDPSDRVGYWLRRFNRGEDVLVPGPRERACNVIDARDVADFVFGIIGSRHEGIFNIACASGPFTFGDLLHATRTVTASDARWHWVSESFLLSRGVVPWTEIPLWTDPMSGTEALMRLSAARAVEAGLVTRPLTHTLAYVLEGLAESEPMSNWLSPERERTLLEEWLGTARAD